MFVQWTQWVGAFRTMTVAEAIGWSLALNFGLFAASLAAGELLVRRFGRRRCSPPPPRLAWTEVLLSLSCVILNTAVMLAGIFLYQRGVVRILLEFPWWRPVVDVLVFLCVMDLAMYLSHRVAHIRWIYPWVHQTHHSHLHPRPLTLFVLNPFEVLAFGGLWLLVISVYPASWVGMSIYLALNLTFGTIGHLGVEPFPTGWERNRWTWWISTSTFHAGHHSDPDHNFGFYTLIWDRLFGTLPSKELTHDR